MLFPGYPPRRLAGCLPAPCRSASALLLHYLLVQRMKVSSRTCSRVVLDWSLLYINPQSKQLRLLAQAVQCTPQQAMTMWQPATPFPKKETFCSPKFKGIHTLQSNTYGKYYFNGKILFHLHQIQLKLHHPFALHL